MKYDVKIDKVGFKSVKYFFFFTSPNANALTYYLFSLSLTKPWPPTKLALATPPCKLVMPSTNSHSSLYLTSESRHQQTLSLSLWQCRGSWHGLCISDLGNVIYGIMMLISGCDMDFSSFSFEVYNGRLGFYLC